MMSESNWSWGIDNESDEENDCEENALLPISTSRQDKKQLNRE